MPMKTIFHIADPSAGITMYELDAKNALASFPAEWFATADEAVEAAKAKADADAAKAKK
jgi:hypothetical protein